MVGVSLQDARIDGGQQHWAEAQVAGALPERAGTNERLMSVEIVGTAEPSLVRYRVVHDCTGQIRNGTVHSPLISTRRS
jgi:hypothetical protein